MNCHDTHVENGTQPAHRVPRRDLVLTELGLGVSQFGNLYRKTTDEEARSAVGDGTVPEYLAGYLPPKT